MDRSAFEAVTLSQVEERAEGEPQPKPGMPTYLDRPWTQLRDEMAAAAVQTIGALPKDRVDVFYHSTKSVYGDLGGFFRRLLRGGDGSR